MCRTPSHISSRRSSPERRRRSSSSSRLAAPSEHPFAIVPGSFHFTTSSGQAGAHADWTTSFEFAPEGGGETYNDVREVVVRVPAGFDASDVAVPMCTQAQLLAANPESASGELPDCPKASQIGDLTVGITVGGLGYVEETVPVYNMEVTSFGVTAELGYKNVAFTGLVQVRVRAEDLGLTATTIDIPPQGETHKVAFTVWGVPAASEHDAMRGARCGYKGEFLPICRNEFGSPQPAGITAKPFLSNPTSCEEKLQAQMFADSYEEPFTSNLSEWPTVAFEVPGYVECDRIPFEPAIAATPYTRSAESATGLDVSLLVAQNWGNALNNLVSSTSSYLKGATVTLPEGMTANPGLAEGLGSCTPEQYARETSASLPCPTGGVPPFKPQVISGTDNNAGGSYSPFYLRLLRGDGEQELVRFSTTLPSGLTGDLSGVAKCSDSAIEAARERREPKSRRTPPVRLRAKSGTRSSAPASARRWRRTPARSTSPAPTTARRCRSSR
jgi:hypothetical protein